MVFPYFLRVYITTTLDISKIYIYYSIHKLYLYQNQLVKDVSPEQIRVAISKQGEKQ